ncbi:MAG: hypothetical protein UY63_C0004G0008 [Parcubacteria group bacterium GW2011_GWA2_51_10]|nr:MAG: hypothetical protein UY63_C0004G0008 [Parcubacteria group bacterium GW2011_GWA2_51_10]
MEKITPNNALEISRELGREAYFTSPFLLAAHGYYEQMNGKLIVYYLDTSDKEMRFLYAPSKIGKEDARGVQFAREIDIKTFEENGITIKEKIPYGPEYFYDCEKLSKSATPDLRKFRQNANYFRHHYSYTIKNQYEPEFVAEFIRNWASTKDLTNYSEFAKGVFIDDLNACLQYLEFTSLPQRNIFVEVDGKLAGFAYTHPLTENLFVGLMQKVNIKYRGLSPFIYQEKARLYPGVPYFTIGCPCGVPGLLAFKDSMRPAKLIETYLLKI